LLGGELGDRRKYTTGIACEEDDVCGVVVGDAGNLGVLDVLDGIGTAGVLCEGGVFVVDNTADGVEDDVLEDGTEADSVENIGLLLSGQTNALGVAATLNVEDTTVSPAVLVVTDQSTLGVSGECGLAGSRQTEEDSNVTVLAFIGRRVQGQDVVLDGHLVKEDSEDTLLHLSSILSTEDDHLLLGKVDGDGSGGGHTLSETVSGEGTSVVDHIVGVEVLEFFGSRADKHIAHEESMVGAGADDTDTDPVALIPTGETVDNVDTVAGVEVIDSTLTVDTPDLRIDVSNSPMYNDVTLQHLQGPCKSDPQTTHDNNKK
jgi:ACT domain-containing protein